MGIRFFCPKGHKLNVKEFLAGKRAICPYCGLRVLVPLESTRVSSRQKKGNAQAQSPAQGMSSLSSPSGVASGVSTPDDVAVGSGSSIIIAGAGSLAEVSDAAAIEPVGGGAFSDSVGDMLTQMSAPTPGANEPTAGSSQVFGDVGDAALAAEYPLAALNDPLAGADNVVWYVRPASGGQLGPAPSDILRHWLAKGRVKADSFVWREGWTDWQLAGSVFPQFASSLSKPNLSGLLAEEQPAAASQTDVEQLLQPTSRGMNTTTKIVLAALILVLVVISVAVIIMSLTGSPPVTPPSRPPSAAVPVESASPRSSPTPSAAPKSVSLSGPTPVATPIPPSTRHIGTHPSSPDQVAQLPGTEQLQDKSRATADFGTLGWVCVVLVGAIGIAILIVLLTK
jgi:hypothetical protein